MSHLSSPGSDYLAPQMQAIDKLGPEMGSARKPSLTTVDGMLLIRMIRYTSRGYPL